MGCSSSRAAPAWVPSMGCSRSGTGCSSMGPPWGHKSCQQTCSSMGSSLSMGPQVLAGAGSRMGSPWGRSFLRASTCSGVGSSMGCRWRSAPPWASTGFRGTVCLAMVFSTGCRGISAPAPGALPHPPSSMTSVSAELFLSHILTPFSPCNCWGFFPPS